MANICALNELLVPCLAISQHTTLQPSLESPIASSRPMPPPAPVTRAICPDISFDRYLIGIKGNIVAWRM